MRRNGETDPGLLALLIDAPLISEYHGQKGFETERFVSDYVAWREELRAYLTAERGWRSIETAPRDGTWLLTIGKNAAGFWTIQQTARWYRQGWQSPVHDQNIIIYHQPTHWMPLPEPPEAA